MKVVIDGVAYVPERFAVGSRVRILRTDRPEYTIGPGALGRHGFVIEPHPTDPPGRVRITFGPAGSWSFFPEDLNATT